MNQITPINLGAGQVELPFVKTWSPTKGFSLRRTFKSNTSFVDVLVLQLRAFNYDVEITQGPYYTVTATLGNDPSNSDGNVPFPTWEMDAAEMHKDILESDLPVVATLGKKNIQILRNAMKYPPANGTDPILDLSSGTTAYKNALMVWHAIVYGMRTIPVFLPVISRTYVIQWQYAVDPSVNANVGNTIITTPTLISSEQVPIWISDDLNVFPAGSQTQDNLTFTYG